MTVIIHSSDLVKRYGDFTAVDGISFEVRAGQSFGFLGPNGAGKTTTIRMITCLSPVTSGDLLIDGLDVQDQSRQIKSLLGVVPQEDNLDPDLSVRRNLEIYSRYFDLPDRVAQDRIEELLSLFQLSDKQEAQIDELSGGLKRRLLIVRALINEPKILILDEPTTGLDPQARHLVWQKLRILKGQGVTMLLTTHNMEEADRLCDRIVVMSNGKIIAEGAPADLVDRYVGREVAELRINRAEQQKAIAALADNSELTIEEMDDFLYLYSRSSGSLNLELLRRLGDLVVYRQANLEDVFFRLTGRGLAE